MMFSRPKKVYAWAFYDWANSAFATTVMAGFFPIFFKQYWSAGQAVTESTFNLGLANSMASVVMVILAPILGAISDRGGNKKRFLAFFACMGIIMTGALWMVGQGAWVMALTLYGLGLIGFSGGNLFYDALLIDITEESTLDVVSALGFALGYVGGGLLFACNVAMTLFSEFFGFADAAEAVRWSFLSVGLWWAVFSLPLFFFVREPAPTSAPGQNPIRDGFRQLKQTFGKLRQLRMTFLFLLAYWLYIDGVDTIVRMAVDYGLSIGFDSNNLMIALLVTQFVGFPAAIVFGRIGERRGARQGIMLAIFCYLLIIFWAYRMEETWEFYALAVAIGLVQGGIQALSRSFYARLIPPDQAGEFFGFYNMLGKFAAVFGPIMMGWVSVLTGDPRLSIASVGLLFISGAIILAFVDEKEGRKAAQSM